MENKLQNRINIKRGFEIIAKPFIFAFVFLVFNFSFFTFDFRLGTFDSGLSTAHASYNSQINYQGKLANASNVTVADGNYSMVFNLYNGGGSSIGWTESDTVAVKSGLFSIMLGNVAPLTGVDFNQTLYLGVAVDGDSEMTPRKILGAVPAAYYAGTSTIALSAQTLQGITPGQFFRNDIQNSTSSSATFMNVLQGGAGKIAEFFASTTQSVLAILSNGNVGIGSSTPSTALVVSGTATIGNLVSTTTTNSSFAGNVGIGTTAPASKLSVLTTSYTDTPTAAVMDLGGAIASPS